MPWPRPILRSSASTGLSALQQMYGFAVVVVIVVWLLAGRARRGNAAR